MAISRLTYPQVVPRAADLMTRAILVTPAREALGETARRAAGRRVRYVLAAIGPGWGGATPETLDRALALGLARAPLRATLSDLPVTAPMAPELEVRRRLVGRAPGLVVVDQGRPVGVVLPVARPGRPGLGRAVAVPLARLDAEALRVLRLAGHLGAARHQVVALVGGAVRDLLLDRARRGTDLDLAVEEDAAGMALALAGATGGQVATHRRFLTATVILPGGRRVDVATARRERYLRPGALPEVEATTLGEDLGRRDFSINAMAVRLDGSHWGEVVDPWGGGDDLAARRIRVLHPLSFIEDPTRIVRAARLAGRLGFRLTRSTHRLAEAATGLDVYAALSGERLRAELELALAEAAVERVLSRLGRLGAFRLVLPGYRFTAAARRRVHAVARHGTRSRVSPGTWHVLLWLGLTAHLEPGEWARWADRLRLPPAQRAAVARARYGAEPLRARLARAGGEAEAYRILERAPEPLAAWALAASRGRVRRYLAAYLDDWRRRPPVLGGEELVALGVSPGPGLGRLLRDLVAEHVDGRVRTRAQAVRWVRRAVMRGRGTASEASG
jgi:tRNA nucleotidyltransferase (CCA-adding enzyme)